LLPGLTQSVRKPLMRKGELLLDKSVKKYYSSYFTGGELKHRDALLFAQGYNSLIDVLKRV